MRVGVRVRFAPTPALWVNDTYLPVVGSVGTVVQAPAPGALGEAVMVRWDGGGYSRLRGRNLESLQILP